MDREKKQEREREIKDNFFGLLIKSLQNLICTT